jgi:hypothetical protein
VTSIGDYAFNGCSALTKLILSPAVLIGEEAFLDCEALDDAAEDKNMPSVPDLLRYRWHRNNAVKERVTALLCLKGTWDHVENLPKRKRIEGVEDPAKLRVSEAREKIPKVLWRVILEFL